MKTTPLAYAVLLLSQALALDARSAAMPDGLDAAHYTTTDFTDATMNFSCERGTELTL